ncbi:hypothetical protein [Cupriavidus taiwanensis]|uniref:hypothetical protein n=1 Tax=Cupriavidus taiwanensis TaxID=164546 RepID=UPI000E102C1A|nr:hypothetical protein [Cupriavidus taiwanensis]SOY56800.1 hypothetical protein CBM2592_A90095 [Cupriavidus taiwanensis]SOY90701.1 hypothetical protein CBM2591_A90094 [Cupriavidus taiwanensis]SOZ63507.1 hypothetical protein CBM2617_A70071 [Cupriavidus taiwanensis]SOZ82511.1 hypothetical protein CBM2618_A80071 [Cupriavidus taiwanensis]SOZ84392.1 hypothetical protein CBM2622_A80071 [Cupriavidus taiwanensis]
MDKGIRKRAVGAEAARLKRCIIRAIRAAGEAGMPQMELVRKLDLGEKAANRLIKMLMEPDCKRVYIARWRLVACRYSPVLMLGDLPDAPRPERKTRTMDSDALENAEAMAKKDIDKAHKEWLRTWVPHCDPAAAWIGRAAA